MAGVRNLDKNNIGELIERYSKTSFYVNKMGELLIKEQIGNTLTNDQFYTLRFIRAKEGRCTSTELAEAFYVNKSAITAIIKRLTDKNLIERTRDKGDRRLVYLALTDEGNELFLNTEQKIQKVVESIITKFDEREVTAFLGAYEKLSSILIDMKENVQEDHL